MSHVVGLHWPHCGALVGKHMPNNKGLLCAGSAAACIVLLLLWVFAAGISMLHAVTRVPPHQHIFCFSAPGLSCSVSLVHADVRNAVISLTKDIVCRVCKYVQRFVTFLAVNWDSMCQVVDVGSW